MVHITSPKVAAITGLSRSWNTTMGGPGSSANAAVFQNGNTSIAEYAANAVTLHNTFNLINGNVTIGAGNLDGEGDITLAGTVNLSGTNSVGVSAGLVNYVTAGQPTGFTIYGTIQGSGNLSKTGVGTMTLSGANTFTGGASVTSKVHKPHLDEMHGPESLPFRPNRATPRKPSLDDPGSGSKIFQPTDSRQSGPEFGPAPRSSGGAPGHRGGWKKR